MNAKRAKALRKQAEQMTVGKPERGYVTLEPANPKTRRLRGTLFVNPETTRGVYLALKRGQVERFWVFIK